MRNLMKRSNGMYYFVVCVNGKRTWRSLYTQDEAEAKRLCQTLQGEFQQKKDFVLSVFGDQFKASASDLKESTVKLYLSALYNLIRICGDKPMKKLSPVDVERFKIARLKEVCPTTLNIDLRALRRMFNEAERLRLIGDNPFNGLRLARVPYKEAGFFSLKEFDRLLNVVKDDHDFRDLILLTTFCMLRRAELVNLLWRDIDFDRCIIHIRSKAGFEVKGGRPRTIPMHPWVEAFLKEKFHNQSINTFVFLDDKGDQLKGPTIGHKFKRYVRRAGLDEGLHWHSLRHTGISWLINRGVAAPFVQQLAGHSSLAVTIGSYSHVENASLIAAMNTFPEIVGASAKMLQ